MLFLLTGFNLILLFNYVCQASEVFACYDQSEYLRPFLQNTILVDVTEGTLVHLYCNYCDIKAVKNKNIHWFYRRRGNNNTKQIRKSKKKNKNFKYIMSSYTLTIKNFSRSDSGIYSCHDVKGDKDILRFVVDSVESSNVKPIYGSLKQSEPIFQIDRVNKILNFSEDDPFKAIRKRNKLLFQVFISWGRWESCKPKPFYTHREGLRHKKGKCRLHSTSLGSDRKDKKYRSEDNITSYYLLDNYDVSCRSIHFNETFPLLSRFLREIPDYELTESCVLEDNRFRTKALATLNDETQTIVIQIAENGHTTLTCAEGETSIKVEWYKDNNLLNDTFRNNMAAKIEPHLTIDVYNTLYILSATKHEEGNYYCTINGIKIREYIIKVVSMAKILNQDFIRYSMYLGFILSLTVTCYCAGLCVAWRRRGSFVDPLNLQYNFKQKVSDTKNEDRKKPFQYEKIN